MKHKILIVVDAQNDFIDGSLANPVAQERVKNIVEKINTFDGDFIFVTKDTHEGNYLSTKEGEKLPVAHCIRGTDGWQVNKDVTYALVKRANDCSVEVVEKPTFGSFELALKIMNIIGDEYEIEIVGFARLCDELPGLGYLAVELNLDCNISGGHSLKRVSSLGVSHGVLTGRADHHCGVCKRRCSLYISNRTGNLGIFALSKRRGRKKE